MRRITDMMDLAKSITSIAGETVRAFRRKTINDMKTVSGSLAQAHSALSEYKIDSNITGTPRTSVGADTTRRADKSPTRSTTSFTKGNKRTASKTSIKSATGSKTTFTNGNKQSPSKPSISSKASIRQTNSGHISNNTLADSRKRSSNDCAISSSNTRGDKGGVREPNNSEARSNNFSSDSNHITIYDPKKQSSPSNAPSNYERRSSMNNAKSNYERHSSINNEPSNYERQPSPIHVPSDHKPHSSINNAPSNYDSQFSINKVPSNYERQPSPTNVPSHYENISPINNVSSNHERQPINLSPNYETQSPINNVPPNYETQSPINNVPPNYETQSSINNVLSNHKGQSSTNKMSSHYDKPSTINNMSSHQPSYMSLPPPKPPSRVDHDILIDMLMSLPPMIMPVPGPLLDSLPQNPYQGPRQPKHVQAQATPLQSPPPSLPPPAFLLPVLPMIQPTINTDDKVTPQKGDLFSKPTYSDYTDPNTCVSRTHRSTCRGDTTQGGTDPKQDKCHDQKMMSSACGEKKIFRKLMRRILRQEFIKTNQNGTRHCSCPRSPAACLSPLASSLESTRNVLPVHDGTLHQHLVNVPDEHPSNEAVKMFHKNTKKQTKTRDKKTIQFRISQRKHGLSVKPLCFNIDLDQLCKLANGNSGEIIKRREDKCSEEEKPKGHLLVEKDNSSDITITDEKRCEEFKGKQYRMTTHHFDKTVMTHSKNAKERRRHGKDSKSDCGTSLNKSFGRAKYKCGETNRHVSSSGLRSKALEWLKERQTKSSAVSGEDPDIKNVTKRLRMLNNNIESTKHEIRNSLLGVTKNKMDAHISPNVLHEATQRRNKRFNRDKEDCNPMWQKERELRNKVKSRCQGAALDFIDFTVRKDNRNEFRQTYIPYYKCVNGSKGEVYNRESVTKTLKDQECNTTPRQTSKEEFEKTMSTHVNEFLDKNESRLSSVLAMKYHEVENIESLELSDETTFGFNEIFQFFSTQLSSHDPLISAISTTTVTREQDNGFPNMSPNSSALYDFDQDVHVLNNVEKNHLAGDSIIYEKGVCASDHNQWTNSFSIQSENIWRQTTERKDTDIRNKDSAENEIAHASNTETISVPKDGCKNDTKTLETDESQQSLSSLPLSPSNTDTLDSASYLESNYRCSTRASDEDNKKQIVQSDTTPSHTGKFTEPESDISINLFKETYCGARRDVARNSCAPKKTQSLIKDKYSAPMNDNSQKSNKCLEPNNGNKQINRTFVPTNDDSKENNIYTAPTIDRSETTCNPKSKENRESQKQYGESYAAIENKQSQSRCNCVKTRGSSSNYPCVLCCRDCPENNKCQYMSRANQLSASNSNGYLSTEGDDSYKSQENTAPVGSNPSCHSGSLGTNKTKQTQSQVECAKTVGKSYNPCQNPYCKQNKNCKAKIKCKRSRSRQYHSSCTQALYNNSGVGQQARDDANLPREGARCKRQNRSSFSRQCKTPGKGGNHEQGNNTGKRGSLGRDNKESKEHDPQNITNDEKQDNLESLKPEKNVIATDKEQVYCCDCGFLCMGLVSTFPPYCYHLTCSQSDPGVLYSQAIPKHEGCKIEADDINRRHMVRLCDSCIYNCCCPFNKMCRSNGKTICGKILKQLERMTSLEVQIDNCLKISNGCCHTKIHVCHQLVKDNAFNRKRVKCEDYKFFQAKRFQLWSRHREEINQIIKKATRPEYRLFSSQSNVNNIEICKPTQRMYWYYQNTRRSDPFGNVDAKLCSDSSSTFSCECSSSTSIEDVLGADITDKHSTSSMMGKQKEAFSKTCDLFNSIDQTCSEMRNTMSSSIASIKCKAAREKNKHPSQND